MASGANNKLYDIIGTFRRPCDIIGTVEGPIIGSFKWKLVFSSMPQC